MFPGGGAGGRFRSKRQVRWALPAATGARNVRALMCPDAPAAYIKRYVRVTRFRPGPHGFAETAGSLRRILTAPSKVARGWATVATATGMMAETA